MSPLFGSSPKWKFDTFKLPRKPFFREGKKPLRFSVCSARADAQVLKWLTALSRIRDLFFVLSGVHFLDFGT